MIIKRYFFSALLIVFYCLENICSISMKYNKKISSLKNNFSLFDTWFGNSSSKLKKSIFLSPALLSLTPMILYKISKVYKNDKALNESRIKSAIKDIGDYLDNLLPDGEEEEKGKKAIKIITNYFEEIKNKLKSCISKKDKKCSMEMNGEVDKKLESINNSLGSIKDTTNKNNIDNAKKAVENLMDGLLLKSNSFRNWFGLKKSLRGFSSNWYIDKLTTFADAYPKVASALQFLLSSGLAYQGLKKLRSFNFDQANRQASDIFRKKLDTIESGKEAFDVMGDTHVVKRYHEFLDKKASNNDIFQKIKKLINEKRYQKLREKIDDSFGWKALLPFSEDFRKVKKDLLPEFNYTRKKNGKERPSQHPIDKDLYQGFFLSSNNGDYNFPFEYVKRNK